MSPTDARVGRCSVPRARVLAIITAVALLLVSGCSLAGLPSVGMDHRVTTDPGASQAAPFDRSSMARTFRATEDGGVEQATARDPTDPAQLDRVRAYLREEAAAFLQGRYEDPARTHGMEMPGSKELEASYGRVRVGYTDLPNGGQLTYATSEQALIQAIHAWFDRRQMGG